MEPWDLWYFWPCQRTTQPSASDHHNTWLHHIVRSKALPRDFSYISGTPIWWENNKSCYFKDKITRSGHVSHSVLYFPYNQATAHKCMSWRTSSDPRLCLKDPTGKPLNRRTHKIHTVLSSFVFFPFFFNHSLIFCFLGLTTCYTVLWIPDYFSFWKTIWLAEKYMKCFLLDSCTQWFHRRNWRCYEPCGRHKEVIELDEQSDQKRWRREWRQPGQRGRD